MGWQDKAALKRSGLIKSLVIAFLVLAGVAISLLSIVMKTTDIASG